MVSSAVWDSQALSIAPSSQESVSSGLQDFQQSWESSDSEIDAVLELQSSSFLNKRQPSNIAVPLVSNKRILNEIKKTQTEKRSTLCRQNICFVITKSLQQFLMNLSLDHSFDNNFFCLFCPLFYSSPKCLRIHIVRSHSSETKESDEILQENENFVSESKTPNETVETFEKHLKIIQKIARGEAGDEVLLRVLSSSSVTLSNAFNFLDQFGSYYNLLFESIFQIIENSLAAPSELC